MMIKTNIASFINWTMNVLGLRPRGDNKTNIAPQENPLYKPSKTPVNTMTKKDVKRNNIVRHEQHK